MPVHQGAAGRLRRELSNCKLTPSTACSLKFAPASFPCACERGSQCPHGARDCSYSRARAGIPISMGLDYTGGCVRQMMGLAVVMVANGGVAPWSRTRAAEANKGIGRRGVVRCVGSPGSHGQASARRHNGADFPSRQRQRNLKTRL